MDLPGLVKKHRPYTTALHCEFIVRCVSNNIVNINIMAQLAMMQWRKCTGKLNSAQTVNEQVVQT